MGDATRYRHAGFRNDGFPWLSGVEALETPVVGRFAPTPLCERLTG